jgi:hypothetical protein
MVANRHIAAPNVIKSGNGFWLSTAGCTSAAHFQVAFGNVLPKCLNGVAITIRDIKPYFASTDSVPDAAVGWHSRRKP